MEVALVTCAALPGLHRDDRVLLNALRERGLDTEPVVWEDPYQDWREPRLCVIRSAWDYAFRHDAFVDWAKSVAAATSLWNSAQIVEWNTHKRYLLDLARCGVPVVPTHLLERGSGAIDLEALLRGLGWQDVVIKAAIAQSGRYAIRVRRDNVSQGQAHLERLLPYEPMLVQPYLHAVEQAGELSVVFIDGHFTHAVRKVPAAGDFRVHEDHGGTVACEPPTHAEIGVAQSALDAVGAPTLYARVDVVCGAGGHPVVMELELVEPELFFSQSMEAVERMVSGIERRIVV